MPLKDARLGAALGVGPGLLRAAIACIAAAALAGAATPRMANAAAKAKPASGNVGLDAALRTPSRWTAGDSDQLLGSLSPDGRTLVYVSNREAVAGAYAAKVGDAAGRALFDEGADVSLPRVSPDGAHMLYLSSRDDATLDVCLRRWPEGDGRRCLGDGRSAESFAFFWPDGRSVGVVARTSMHGEMLLRKVPIDGSQRVADAEVVVDRSVATPAIDPSGRWLAYVAVERASAAVGVQFAMQLGDGLRFKRLGSGKRDRVVRFELPGASGFPAFSADGRWLYFAQALGDSNDDGAIDGDDRSVLFRAAFDPSADPPLRAEGAEQLTAANWSCRYPAPGRRHLVLTCEVGGRLDVFALPLDGLVPSAWSEARLWLARDGAVDVATRALLSAHLQRRAPHGEGRADGWLELARLSLADGDLAAGRWYARHAGALATAPPPTAAPAGTTAASEAAWRARVAGQAAALAGLCEHRAESRRLERGGRDEAYAGAQLARIEALTATAAAGGADVAAVARLVIAEIEDALGREERAAIALGAVAPGAAAAPLTSRLLADLGVARWRALEDDAEAQRWLVALADSAALREPERLELAARALALATRGVGPAGRDAALRALAARAAPGGALALCVEVELALAPLAADLTTAPTAATAATAPQAADPAVQERVRASVFAIYQRERGLDRRRAIVRATLATAAARDATQLLYTFAATWVSFVPRDHPERALAVDVYRQVVLERGYAAWAQGGFGEARGSFFGLTLIDDDLEAQLGFAMARLRELDGGPQQGPSAASAAASAAAATRRPRHQATVAAEVERRYAATPDATPRRVLAAWLRLQGLAGAADDDARAALLDAADTDLEVATADGRPSRHLQLLRGHVAHQRFLLGQGRAYAVVAHDRYRLALELAAGDGRLQATLWHASGLLQAAVGNHRQALESYARAAALPLDGALRDAALRLARARSRWHVGGGALFGIGDDRGEQARRAALADARDAVAACDAAEGGAAGAALRALLPLALDRLALYAFDLGDPAASLAASSRALQLPVGSGALARANRARLLLVRAAAALAAGRAALALEALAGADRMLAGLDDDAIAAGRRAHEPRLAAGRARLLSLAAGLRGRALLATGAAAAAIRAFEGRIAGLGELADEDAGLLARAAARWHLALARAAGGDRVGALGEIGHGLRDCARFAKATGTDAPAERVWLVEAALELRLFGGAPAAALGVDLASEAESLYRALCDHGHPRWRAARDRLQLYLTLLDVTSPHAGRAGPGETPR